ncbi:hypothetical protein [Rhodoferax aquaticus]|uniref:Uncharacterized protein n=1 Tax=Rhodoferax aquaticus TaxID=2527691 RepID=A0A515EMV2_9BURK|nr:hypothetical protein [Rhodoferax aquaticus]QDL53958.1 hypothetical protein EXZ61_07130 [Rhodoferax aquaticus]
MLGLALGLSACGGGGGGGSATATPSPASYDVASSSASMASALGATDIAVSAGDTAAVAGATSAMDMTADVGDTWRFVFNAFTSKFKLLPLQTAYGLTQTSDEGTFTKTTSGTIDTYSGNFGTPGQANGGSITIKYDTRTKSLIGSVSWHNGTTTLSSAVTGSKLAMGASITSLAGDYVFANQARNQSNGQSPSSTPGTLNIASNGLVKLCPGAKYNAASGNCLRLDGTTPNDGSQIPVTLQLAANAGGNLTLTPTGSNTLTLPNGVTHIKAHIQAGDLGPVLVIDQDWLNASNVRRTGVFVAARIQAIDSAKFSGNFYCPTIQVNGNTGGTIRVTPTSFNLVGGSQAAVIAINKVYDTGTSVERDLAGAFHMTGTDSNNQPLHQFGFQLSSSLFVFQNGGLDRLNFCQRT